MTNEDLDSFYPASKQEWRQWLEENHRLKQSVWLVYYKKKSGMPSISWSEAVDQALCFGWIDSTAKPIDEHTYKQFFTKRKPKSVWSKVNKQKIERLIEQGLMVQAGHECIEIAKLNGSWTILDDVEELTIPEDLEKEFNTQPNLKDFFLSLSKSVRKSILHRLKMAKRLETRQKRIAEIAELAAQKLKPKQF